MKTLKYSLGGLLLLYNILTFALSADESLEVWNTNTVSIRLTLCEMMMEKLVKIKLLNSTPQDLYMCISEVAKDPGLLYMKISETAAACAVLLD